MILKWRISVWLKVLNVYQPDEARTEPIQSKHITDKHEENSVVEFFLPPSSLFFIVWAICPLSQLAKGWRGGEEGDSYRQRTDSFLLQEPAPAGFRRGRSEAGEWERTDRVTHVESVIYFFIIKIREGTGAEDGEVNLMTQA